ncbi:MAG: SDR family NAD(P)-dependent oxidoreductase [Clostridiales bacterium]|nr:SDR family NAD(P)-dependent oxidoreductase [Clostridiales bacterium]
MDYKLIAVITGASRGIGFYTARCLIEKGYTVYDLSRKGGAEDVLWHHIDCDVSEQTSVAAAFEQICEAEGKLDLLICNAGYGIAGAIEDTDIEQAKNQFAVNFFGACNCIKTALPSLRASHGRIILISSLAGPLPIPFQAYYSASKAALNALALALAQEVKAFGVSVAIVLPGDAKSAFGTARVKTTVTASVYSNRIARSLAVMERDELNGMETTYVAKKIAAIACNKRVRLFNTIGFQYKLFYLLQKLLPLSLVRFIVGKIYA